MKDITISGKTLKKELFIILGCFVAAVLVNVYAIIHYDRPAVELLSQIGYTVFVAVVIYFLLWTVRLVALCIKLITKKLLSD